VLGSSARIPYRAPAAPIVEDESQKAEPKAELKKKNGESFEKVVRRIPTLYVITFAAVVTFCAVLIIWNTLQVNRFTLEKTKLEQDIEQAKQRIIKLKAQEMQLSAPDRIRQVAKTKFGMVESDGINEYTIPSQ
jgi:cell division protein FtsL